MITNTLHEYAHVRDFRYLARTFEYDNVEISRESKIIRRRAARKSTRERLCSQCHLTFTTARCTECDATTVESTRVEMSADTLLLHNAMHNVRA